VLLVIKLFVLQKIGNFDLNNFLPSAATAVIGRFLFRSWFLESALLLEGFACGGNLLLFRWYLLRCKTYLCFFDI